MKAFGGWGWILVEHTDTHKSGLAETETMRGKQPNNAASFLHVLDKKKNTEY